MAAKEYRRLPGRGVRRNLIFAATRCRLWLGRDHLLSVDSLWFAEDYKRFYFRDIQAVIIRKTAIGKIVNITLAGLAFLPLLATLSLALGAGDSAGFVVFWGIVSGSLISLLILNTLMGPTCTCHLKTAVQTEELPTLRRLRRARKVLRRLRPFIVEAQGELAPEEIAARMSSGQQAFAAPPAAAVEPAVFTENPEAPLPPPGT